MVISADPLPSTTGTGVDVTPTTKNGANQLGKGAAKGLLGAVVFLWLMCSFVPTGYA
jgi:hypothetical protein